MCGIAGVLAPGGEAPVSSLLDRLAHRGPDDHGWLLLQDECAAAGRGTPPAGRADLALVHRRLSILDLSPAGWQPMRTPDGRYAIVYNGEIYNYRELRDALAREGCTFASRSDTEVLLAAYARWGAGALTRLVGMFAFAILDTQRRTLFLARDFFGIKPLFYTTAGGGFAFASEAKALLDLPGVSRAANADRLYLFLRYGLADHGGETLFADLQQLPAAHYMEVSLDRPAEARPVRYWDLVPGADPGLSFDEAAARMRELFLESVDLHLRSDVAVGAALSGGVDSSAIVMAMRHLRGPALDVHAFTFVADDARLSEERWADLVGRAAGVHLHKVRADQADMAAELEALVRRQDEPFASTSIYAQHLVFRAARAAGITVMLDGQGADELLAGYPAYGGARLASLVRAGRLADAVRLGAHLSGGWRQSLQAGQYLVPPALQAPFRRLVGQRVAPAWLDASWMSRNEVRPRPRRGPMPRRDLLRHDLRETLTETNLPALLRYEDRNSMAHSVESRVPFLVPRLAEFALSLPEEYILAADGTTKAVFRAAMRGIVPDAILDRRDKVGFVTPEQTWLRELGPWVDTTLRSLREHPIAPLVTDVVLREWEAVRRGTARFDSRVWRRLNLVLWARQHDVTFGEEGRA